MRPTGGARLLLVAVAALLSAAAALAIGILLVGDLGDTEGRVLVTTALLAGYALLVIPAALLYDRRRLRAVAAVVVALAAAAAAVTIAAVWAEDPAEEVGKAIGTLNGWLVASVQVAALAVRRRERDPRSVRALFAASSVLGVVLAGMLSALLWADIDAEAYGRIFGALIVLDALLVALQPVLARVKRPTTVHAVRVVLESGEIVELRIEAVDVAGAAEQAIRRSSRGGARVLAVELGDRTATVGRESAA